MKVFFFFVDVFFVWFWWYVVGFVNEVLDVGVVVEE